MKELRLSSEQLSRQTTSNMAGSLSPGPFDAGGRQHHTTSKAESFYKDDAREETRSRSQHQELRSRLVSRHRSSKQNTLQIPPPLTSIYLKLIIIILASLMTHEFVTLAYTTSNSDSNMNPFVSYNHQSAATGSSQQRHSGHYSLSELCPRNRPIPAWKKVDGTVISLSGAHDFNCTVSLQTRLPNQHFIVRFEELRLGCSDKLRLFDGDVIYGQPSIKDYSCRDNMANVQPLRSTGTFLTLSYNPGLNTGPRADSDGFRFVVTAVYDNSAREECPLDASLCRNEFCISKALFCDGINHCLDSSDELNCLESSSSATGTSMNSLNGFGIGRQSNNGWLSFDNNGYASTSDMNLSNALKLLVILVLIIFACVIIFISAIYCRRDPSSSSSAAAAVAAAQHPHATHFAQYQHQLAQARGAQIEMPLHSSSSVMFTNPAAFAASPHHQHQQQYAQTYFQPVLATATLDRRGNLQHHWQPAPAGTAFQATPTGPRLVQLHQHPAATGMQPLMGLVNVGHPAATAQHGGGLVGSTTASQLAAAFPGGPPAPAPTPGPQQQLANRLQPVTSRPNGLMPSSPTIHVNNPNNQHQHQHQV